MSSDGASPISAANLSALGKALDETTISSNDISLGSDGDASPSAAHDVGGVEHIDGAGVDGNDAHDAHAEGEDEHDDEEDEDDIGEYDELDGDDLGDHAVTEDNGDDEDDDFRSQSNKMDSQPNKSPKKRERTDSLKKMLPAPAAQRHKQVVPATGANSNAARGNRTDTDESPASSSSSAMGQVKLLVKDRKGTGMGVPRAHLILNAVKQAPPAKEKSNPRRWSKHEDESLRLAVERSGERNWKAIADQVPGRNHTQCLQRWTKVLKPGLIKGHWTPEEDLKLRDLVAEGKKNWGQVASLIPGRTSKQCRERWCNHLDPNINKGSYTEDEDKIIIEMQAKLGNRWSIIAQQLKGRTEDAVKIRWKSLMRGRRAASKDDKAQASYPTGLSTADSMISRSKSNKTTSVKQKTRGSTTAIKAEKELSTPVTGAFQDPLSAGLEMSPNPITGATLLSTDTNGVTQIEPANLSTALNSGMQNVNDLVAASIHNFKMSQGFHPHATHANGIFTNHNMPKTISPANHAVYAVPGGYNVALQPHAYAVPGYQLPNNMNLPQNYVVPTNFGTSQQMAMMNQVNSGGSGLQHFQGVQPNGMPNVSTATSRPTSLPPTPTYPTQALTMAVTGIAYPQNAMSGSNTSFGTSHQGIVSGSIATTPATSTPLIGGTGVNIGLPPSSAAAAGKVLNTPREEWGSSQTPRSQMILTEGHASAYELFHQQRLRLMLKEREKHGLSLISAPSPGQALLTKELEANKERQKRQAIMQKGWKSAVDAMMAFNNDLSSLDDQQRFDGIMEKVSLSALDPTDEELLDQSVEIIPPDDGEEVDNPVE